MCDEVEAQNLAETDNTEGETSYRSFESEDGVDAAADWPRYVGAAHRQMGMASGVTGEQQSFHREQTKPLVILETRLPALALLLEAQKKLKRSI